MDIFFSVFIYILNIIFVTFYTSLAYKREKNKITVKGESNVSSKIYYNDRLKISSKYMLIFFAILCASLLAGLRYNVGSDFLQYYKDSQEVAQTSWFTQDVRYNIGYIFLCKLIYGIGCNSSLFLFIYEFLTMLFLFMAIDREKNNINPTLAVFMYMCLYYQMSFNWVRQYLAITICFYAITYLEENNLKFVFWIIIAYLLHTSAIICLLALPVKYFIRCKYKNMVILMICCISLLIVVRYPMFTGIIEKYFGKHFGDYFALWYATTGSYLTYIIKNLPYLIIILLAMKYIEYDNKYLTISVLTVIGMIIGMIVVYNDSSMDRIAAYFNYLLIFTIPYSLKHMIIKKHWQLVVKSLLILFVIIMWFYYYIVMQRGETIPYNFI